MIPIHHHQNQCEKTMEKPKRKRIRLEGYDYSQNNAYFITICSKMKNNLFWKSASPNQTIDADFLPLSKIGHVIEDTIQNIPLVYRNIEIDIFMIMPNHIHMILCITDDLGPTPTISTVINQFKGIVTKRVGYPIWQKSFYDRIIRNEKEYQFIWDYIYYNPVNWVDDTKYGS